MYYHTINKAGMGVPKTKPEIDSLYVYKTRSTFPFRQKKQVAEYKYSNHGVPEVAKEGEIYSFVRTVEIDGVKRNLLMITKDSRKTYVEKFFKKAVKDIKDSQDIMEKFKSSGIRPTRLGIEYIY